MGKLMALLFFAKNLYFSHKIEHKNITDPSQDVTDDFSIRGKVLQQRKRLFSSRIKTWRDMLPDDR